MTGPRTPPGLPQSVEAGPVDREATACNGASHALDSLGMTAGPVQNGHAGPVGSGAVTRSQTVSSRNVSSAAPAPRSRIPNAQGGRPSATRSASARRVRLVQEARRGRVQAMHHGIYARVANLPDVATEVALQMALRPGLDPLRDLRLVEDYAMASVQLRRAHEAIEAQGLTEHLGSFISRQGPLVERGERQLHDRERERLAGKAAGADPLARYRSKSAGSGANGSGASGS
jgi:hypothetical protein